MAIHALDGTGALSLFDHRDAFRDYAEVRSHVRFEAGDLSVQPVVTIAIPTFRRPKVLLEAIESALCQTSDVPFEVLVLDNDPDEAAIATISGNLPRSPAHALRYMSNDQNIGMFGNWNRCIELARGEWITILNDDDLLRPEYLARTMSVIRKRPEIDGLAPRKSTYDRRPDRQQRPINNTKQKLLDRLRRMRFDRDGLSLVSPRTLFFGNELGNGLGFLFRKKAALGLGGYRPEDFPSSDGFFYLRMSTRFNLFWLYDVLADIGIDDNESQRPETLLTAVSQGQQLRSTLAGSYVPQRWMKLHPQLMANSIYDAKRLWNVELNRKYFEHRFNLVLPRPNYRRVSLFRLLHGAF